MWGPPNYYTIYYILYTTLYYTGTILYYFVVEPCVCLVLEPAIQSAPVLRPPYFYLRSKITNAVFEYSNIRQLVVEILKYYY